MKKLSILNTIEYLCKQNKQWGVYISWVVDETVSYQWTEGELCKAAPYLSIEDDFQIMSDGNGFIFCDSEEEAYNIFDQTIGDDWPTKLNSYNGEFRVYASVVGPNGYETENT